MKGDIGAGGYTPDPDHNDYESRIGAQALKRTLVDNGVAVAIDVGTRADPPMHHVSIAWNDYRLDVRYATNIEDALLSLTSDWYAIEAMRAAGYDVVLSGGNGGGPNRVTVSKRNEGGKAHEPRWLYKQATSSTSGYPIQAAYGKWAFHHGFEGGAA